MRPVGMLLAIAACGGAGAEHEWQGVVESLPNGAVRVSNPARGVWPEGGGWRLVPELQLGEVDGPEPVIFSAISGLESDAAGRIYLLDRQANELRIFSPEGVHLRTVGRAGRGPGEYSGANGLLWLSPDTLVVVDQRGERYTLLSREGEYIRSVPRTLLFYGWVFSGGRANGRIYELSHVGRDPEHPRPALVGTPLLEESAESAPSAATRPEVETGKDTVLLPAPTGPIYQVFSVRTDRGGMTMSVPFAPGLVYHLDHTGRIWMGHGSEFRLIRTGLAGDTLMEILLDAEPVPVTPAEREEWEQGESVERFRQMGGRLDLDRVPRVKPYFDGLYLDPDRNLWVSIPAGPQEMVFAVFDSGGRFLGRLQASGFRRSGYILPVVRNGRLYVAGTDELDVPRAYVFRVEK